MSSNVLPDADVKIHGDQIFITIRNDQIINALANKLQGEFGRVISVDCNGEYITLTVDLSDIEKRYNDEFKTRFGINENFLEIENKTTRVKIKRSALKLMLEKLFKGMTVLDYGDRFEISGRIDLSSIPTNVLQNMGSGFQFMPK